MARSLRTPALRRLDVEHFFTPLACDFLHIFGVDPSICQRPAYRLRVKVIRDKMNLPVFHQHFPFDVCTTPVTRRPQPELSDYQPKLNFLGAGEAACVGVDCVVAGRPAAAFLRVSYSSADRKKSILFPSTHSPARSPLLIWYLSIFKRACPQPP